MTETIEPTPTHIDQRQLAQELVGKSCADRDQLVRPAGLLAGLTKTVLETALEAKMSEPPGDDKHDTRTEPG